MERSAQKSRRTRLLIVSVLVVIVVGGLSRCITFSDSSQSYDQPKNNAHITCNSVIGNALYSELASLWKSGDKECFLRAMDELQDRKDVEAGVRAIREILSDTNAPLSQDDLSKLTALNYFVPKVFRGFDGGDISKYRKYLLELVRAENSAPVRSLAITVLGYYRDDADIELFTDIAKSDKAHDSELVSGVFSLSNSCSAKAKNALSVVAGSQRFKEYETKYSQKSELRTFVSECINR